MLRLEIKAPFATFRTFTTGSYRPTAYFMPPSVAYGLLLNIAGIETRFDDGRSPTTITAGNLPAVRLALAALPRKDNANSPDLPDVGTVFQQLHNYPVGGSRREHAPLTKGTKYNITPVRREFLHSFRALIAVEAGADLEARIRQGLAGTLETPRYGLPFLGDNSFLPDVINPDVPADQEGFWYCRLNEPEDVGPREGVTRLTIWIDRTDMSRTQSALFAPIEQANDSIPEEAWTWIKPPA